MKMELEKIGSRHRDSTNHFAAESEALDQIAKEVSVDLIPNRTSIIGTWEICGLVIFSINENFNLCQFDFI